jgi:hypothetical protein
MEVFKGKGFVRLNQFEFDTKMNDAEVWKRFDEYIRKLKLFRATQFFNTEGQFLLWTKPASVFTGEGERLLGMMEGSYEEILFAAMRITNFGRAELVTATPVKEVFEHIPGVLGLLRSPLPA